MSGCYDRHRDPEFNTPYIDQERIDQLTEWRDKRLLAMQLFTGSDHVDPDQEMLDQLEALGYVDEEER